VIHTLDAVYRDFAERLNGLGTLVCAGGAVRDHLRAKPAKDYDLFLLGRTLDDDLAAKIKERLGALEELKPLEFHKSEPYLVTTVRSEGVDVQVMVNPAPTLDDLLATFDWNVCLFGYDGQVCAQESIDNIAPGIDNIAPGKDLRLQKVTFPLSTLRRGFRFSERFGMRLICDDALRLCRLVADGARIEPDMPALAANVLVEDPR